MNVKAVTDPVCNPLFKECELQYRNSILSRKFEIFWWNTILRL